VFTIPQIKKRKHNRLKPDGPNVYIMFVFPEHAMQEDSVKKIILISSSCSVGTEKPSLDLAAWAGKKNQAGPGRFAPSPLKSIVAPSANPEILNGGQFSG